MPAKKHKPMEPPGEGTLTRVVWDALWKTPGREVDIFQAVQDTGLYGIPDRKTGLSTTIRALENNYDCEIECVKPKVYILKGIWDGKDWKTFDGKEVATVP